VTRAAIAAALADYQADAPGSGASTGEAKARRGVMALPSDDAYQCAAIPWDSATGTIDLPGMMTSTSLPPTGMVLRTPTLLDLVTGPRVLADAPHTDNKCVSLMK
jgi:hypothetical protein